MWLRTNALAVLSFSPPCSLSCACAIPRGVNQIVDLFPSLARTMQPLTRVASLLDSVPKIVSAAAPFSGLANSNTGVDAQEPHPENKASLNRLRPDRFEGSIEFDSVDFTYP